MKCWGKELTIDCYGCDMGSIQDKHHLRAWVINLVKEIKMVAYGDPQIIHFGKGDPKLAGNTVLQFIETSNITAHFNDFDGSAAINVFSCKDFDPDVVIANINKWFKPKHTQSEIKDRIPEL